MKNGSAVAEFEARFAEYVGANFAVALCNGTATLHTALVALGVQPGDRVAVPPLTMASTTIAVLHAGAVPVFCDVDERTWLMQPQDADSAVLMPVSLYGLNRPWIADAMQPRGSVIDAAQTLSAFKTFGQRAGSFQSYSFQASKILALGEGGMLVTDSETLATRAREFSSLGYRMDAKQPRIDKDRIKASGAVRHHFYPAWNYRMSDEVAIRGCMLLSPFNHSSRRPIDKMVGGRKRNARFYRDAIAGCSWITPQRVPEGWTHDYWTYAVACDTPERANLLSDLIVKYKGERPYAAWRLTYQEPAFRHLTMEIADDWDSEGSARGICPIAESLQPRLLQFQTNNLASAEQNARALRQAIEEMT